MELLPPHLKLKILSSLGQQIDDVVSPNAPMEISEVIQLSKLQESKLNFFTAEDLQNLQGKGYIVKEGLLQTKDKVRAVWDSILQLEKDGILKPAGMQNSNHKWKQSGIRGDKMAFITSMEMKNTAALDEVSRAMDALKTELNESVDFQCSKVSIQAAVYPGGGSRYVKHLDSCKGGPRRRLTVLFYPNIDWKEGDGGELRLYLPVRKRTTKQGEKVDAGLEGKMSEASQKAEVVDVKPTGNKVVVFLSDCVEHEVLKSNEKRAALTMWLC
uniref:Fe2OG dioxygenase domain-containing protein n=1 Tax=Lotharella oceanica TaxID=641309 RepID=A0A7S2XCV6_9EUKA|mmetsp:Transcript_29869/g.55856  ORF Transcript_29869/g.55856 Transcript_29869/m.55856 type:complete len:271 (+) Transcript_29869:48-860(+)